VVIVLVARASPVNSSVLATAGDEPPKAKAAVLGAFVALAKALLPEDKLAEVAQLVPFQICVTSLVGPPLKANAAVCVPQNPRPVDPTLKVAGRLVQLVPSNEIVEVIGVGGVDDNPPQFKADQFEFPQIDYYIVFEEQNQ
jgi:hypothetical protein